MFSKSITKLGSQKSHSSRVNDKKLLEQFKDIYFVFFFEKGKYREISLDSNAWPDTLSYTERTLVKKDEKILLYFENDFHYGRFVAKGDVDLVKLLSDKMDEKIDKANTSTEVANLSFGRETLESENDRRAASQPLLKRSFGDLRSLKENVDPAKAKRTADEDIQVLSQSSCTPPAKKLFQSKLPLVEAASLTLKRKDYPENGNQDHAQSHGIGDPVEDVNDSPAVVVQSETENSDNDEDDDDDDDNEVGDLDDQNSDSSSGILKSVCKAVRSVKKVMDAQRRETRQLRLFLESQLKECPSVSHSVAVTGNSLAPVLRNGEDMTKVQGKTPKKYGRNLARKFFTEEEILNQRSNPRKSTSLPSLDPNDLEVIRVLVEGRFPGQWADAFEAIDDLGRDIKKKMVRQQKNSETAKTQTQLSQDTSSTE